MLELYCVVFRTGGTERFKWHRSLAMSRADVQRCRLRTERMGYEAHIAFYHDSLEKGLPTTYDYPADDERAHGIPVVAPPRSRLTQVWRGLRGAGRGDVSTR